jgi:hypothetical protein
VPIVRKTLSPQTIGVEYAGEWAARPWRFVVVQTTDAMTTLAEGYKVE